MCQDSLKTYLDDLASTKPAPGGGSAAALAGAVGAALMSKVANFTIGKEKYKAVEEEISGLLDDSELLREDFGRLSSEDIHAYQGLAAAFRMPKETPAEKKERQQKVQQALKEATSVPFEICQDAHKAIKLCLPLVKKGNANLITDSGIAAIMFKCAFESALLNVEINLKSIKDSEFVLKIRKELKPMQKEIDAINQKVNSEVKKHLGGLR